MTQSKPRVCVSAQFIGLESEVWMLRQIYGLTRLEPRVLTWNCVNEGPLREKNIPIEVLPYPFDLPKGIHRRLTNLRRLGKGNICASLGPERRHLRAYLKRTRPAVILCHFGYLALRLLPTAKELGIPLVVHFHGLDVSSMLRHWPYRWSLKRHLPSFAEIIVVGIHQRDWVKAQGIDSRRIHLIPCGVPTGEFAAKADYGRETEAVEFIAVSRLVETKGLDYALQAFAGVYRDKPASRFTIVGDGPERERLERLADEFNLREAVTFTGVLEPANIHNALIRADIFLQHSVISSNGATEGFGVSVAEASSSGLPVVCSDSTGIRDQVVSGTTGYLVPQRDVAAMRDKMMLLADNPDLRLALGQAGRQHMIRNFDTQGQIDKLERVLLGVLEETSVDSTSGSLST